MTLADALAQLAAGFRLALVLFAVMSLLTLYRGPASDELWERLKNRGWALIALSAFCYSPAHAAWLIGWPAPRDITRTLDVVASALACVSFIHLLAARGLRRGLSSARVRRGAIANVAVLIAVVGSVWILR